MERLAAAECSQIDETQIAIQHDDAECERSEQHRWSRSSVADCRRCWATCESEQQLLPVPMRSECRASPSSRRNPVDSDFELCIEFGAAIRGRCGGGERTRRGDLPSLPFSDVGRYGDGSAPHLATSPYRSLSGNVARQSVGRSRQRPSPPAMRRDRDKSEYAAIEGSPLQAAVAIGARVAVTSRRMSRVSACSVISFDPDISA